MKITIIGSTSYKSKMETYAAELIAEGHEVCTPMFDSQEGFDELQICEWNRENIIWADRVDIFWDCRSMGTVFDFGLAFAYWKPIKVVYLEPKTMMGVMKKYEAKVG